MVMYWCLIWWCILCWGFILVWLIFWCWCCFGICLMSFVGLVREYGWWMWFWVFLIMYRCLYLWFVMYVYWYEMIFFGLLFGLLSMLVGWYRNLVIMIWLLFGWIGLFNLFGMVVRICLFIGWFGLVICLCIMVVLNRWLSMLWLCWILFRICGYVVLWCNGLFMVMCWFRIVMFVCGCWSF